MPMLLCALASALLFQATSSSTVLSPDGRFAATWRSGEVVVERVTPEGAREKLWSAAHACEGAASAHLVADGGFALVHVEARVTERRAPVVVLGPEGRTVAAEAGALDIGANEGDWIELSARAIRFGPGRPPRGGPAVLDLLGRDGRLRTVDLESEQVMVVRPSSAAVLEVTPSALPEGGRLMIVGSWSLPPAIAAGEPLPIEVVLLIPAPAHARTSYALAGFQALWRAEQGFVEVLPLGRIAATNEPDAHQVRAVAKLSGLAPGRHRILVDGAKGSTGARNAHELLVLPAERRVALATSGGILGQRRRIELWSNGVWIDTGLRGESLEAGLAPHAEWRAIEDALASLPAAAELPERLPDTPGADFVHSDLTWTDASGPRHAVRDDGTLAEPLSAVVRLLVELATPPDRESATPGAAALATSPSRAPDAKPAAATPAPAPPAAATPAPAPPAAATPAPTPKVPRWTIDPKASRIAVHTRSGGLLSAFGHDHTLEPRTFSGFVELDPARVGSARLELSIDARSLAVTNAESRDDGPEIEENTRAKVLESERYPAILFTSTKVEARPLGTKGGWKVALTGDLSMHGRSRSIVVPGSFTIEEGTLHALGELELAMSDWKIRPPSAAIGTVKVADRFKLSFDLVAREPK